MICAQTTLWKDGIAEWVLSWPKPNVYEFIDKLKGEQSHTDMIINQLIAGQSPKTPRRKVHAAYKRLSHIVSEYTERPVLEFLQGIAMNIRY